MAKKGKKKGKKAGAEGESPNNGGERTNTKEEPLSVMESILSFQMEVRVKTIEAFKEEISQLQEENKECKDRTLKLQSEQLNYVKQSMKAAKDFDVDYQNTLTELQSKVEAALKNKGEEVQREQVLENELKDKCAVVQKEIDDLLDRKAQLLDYKENGSVLHRKNIDILKSTIDDINGSFDENAAYIQKNLRLTLDEISKDTASKVDSQKYQATDRAIQLLDPRNYTVAQQNAWLKSEVNLLRNDIERLWKEVEKLEIDNIAMLTDMYDERMMDIKRSRQHYMDCVKKGTVFGNRDTLLVTPQNEDFTDSEQEEEEEESEGGEEIALSDGDLQLLSIQGTLKPLYDRPADIEDDSCLVAVSSFEWTLDDKATVSLTTL